MGGGPGLLAERQGAAGGLSVLPLALSAAGAVDAGLSAGSDGQASGEAPVFNAAIKEGVRLTSLVLLGLTRRAPSGGAIFCGAYFPEGVSFLPRLYTV